MRRLAGLLSLTLVTMTAMAQDTHSIQLETFWFVFFESGENKNPMTKEEREAQLKGHLGNLNRMSDEGKCIAAGPFGGDQARRGIVILKQDKLKTKQDVLNEFANDPFVNGDRLRVDLHAWMTLKGSVKKWREPEEIKSYVFVILSTGDDTTVLPEKEAGDLQTAHLGHIIAMMKDNELGLAGPFSEDTPMRGLLFFKHSDVEKAKAIVEKDPLISRKRLKATYLVLWMAAGIVGD